MPNNEVNLTVIDGALGNVNVPAAKTQAVIGCCSGGTANQIISTTSKAALIAALGYGPLVEAAALKIDAGATVLCVKAPSNTPGAAGSVVFSGTGTSVITVDGGSAPYDDYEVVFKTVNGGTRGTAGIKFSISLDGGRSFGPVLALGTATTYTIPNTGVIIDFAAGTLVAGDTATFSTTAPLWNTAGVQAAIVALQTSPNTWGGGIHVVGVASESAASAIQGYLDTLATQYRYTFAFLDTADATAALASNEAAWITALEADYGALSAVRICAGAGYVNIQSPIPNPAAGAPQYRRPFTWSAARRAAQVDIQVHLGRVRDGALGVTSFGPTSDGLLYHDERVTPGLDGARFMAATTRIGFPGVWVKNPNLMSPPGSDFSMLMYRQVMDVACFVTHAVLENYINDSVRLNPASGFIVEQDARNIESAGNTALANNLTSKGACSDAKMVVSRTDAINTTKTLTASVRVLALGYILEIDVTLGFTNPVFVS